MNRPPYVRVALLTVVPVLLAAAPVIWGSNESVGTMFNAPLQWISRDSAARTQFNRFLSEFDSHEIVLISWPGCTVDDGRLQDVADALMADAQQRKYRRQPELLGQVLTGYSMLRSLMGDPAGLARSEALQRLQGTLVGKDLQTSCAVVVLTEAGSVRRRETIALILETIQRVTGFSRDGLYLAGPPIDGLATDNESIRSLQRFSLPAIIISLLLCCLCLRSVWLTLPILVVGALGQAAMLAAVYFLGETMNAILIVLPPLVFVLTVSAGVHLVNYFYDELRLGNADQTVTRALRKGLGPCTLAAVTTAVGLASLMVSEVSPVRQFGILAACGVLVTVLLLFLLLPGAMESRRAFTTRRQRTAVDQPIPASVPTTRRGVSAAAGAMVWRYGTWISLGCLALLLFCGAGLAWLRSSINVISLLDSHNRAVRDFRWFESHIGPLVPVEVVVHFDNTCALDPLQRLELVRSAQDRLAEIDVLGGAMSAASFFPRIPPPGGLRATARRAALRRRVVSTEADLVDAQFLSVSGHQQSWRISARVLGLDDFDYGKFLDRLRERVAPIIAQYEQSGFHGVSATYTGVTAVVYEVERALLVDLYNSFLTALAFVTLIMMLALRGIRAGLVAMVPNVFPPIILFGCMGWLGHPVDIGTVMTASVALGIAVDGTFHFLKWFGHELELGRPRRKAITYAYRHCGGALVQTTVICACGLLVFGFSGFLPARYFSINLLLLLLAALFGDLVVLPALLAGPLGSFFVRRRPHGGHTPGRRVGAQSSQATCGSCQA